MSDSMSQAAPLAGQQSIDVTVGDIGVPTVPSSFVIACDARQNSLSASSFLNDRKGRYGDNGDGHPVASQAAPLAGQHSIDTGLTACDACPNSSSFLNDSDCEGDNSDGHPFVSIDAPLAGHQSVDLFTVGLKKKK